MKARQARQRLQQIVDDLEALKAHESDPDKAEDVAKQKRFLRNARNTLLTVLPQEEHQEWVAKTGG